MSEEERKFLEIVDLKKGFGSGETRQEVLRGMNFSVAKGEFCVLLGPSGSGKSTLLNIIGGIDSADSGYISINGDKLKDMSEKKLTQYRRKHLGYVFQMYNLIANLNVKENIEVGAYLSDNALDIDELLHTLGLYEHRYKLPNQLSGGQQQRVSIGRAIVKNPDILLCDEPTGALDYNTSKEILKLIEDVNKKYGNTIIMVTHNEAEFCVLLGPSGSGKSTLLNIIGGIDSADSGYISINGDKLKDMSEKKLTQYRRKHLGYVFQMYNLIANLNVKENIEVGAYLSDNALDIDELLHTLGLYEHRYKLPNQLSGGQQQRVSIGRAIVKNPDILLCDEPTGALDYNTSKEILKLIEDVNKKYGNTIIMVTHNEAIKNMADHVIKLRDGAVRHNDININKVSAEELEW